MWLCSRIESFYTQWQEGLEDETEANLLPLSWNMDLSRRLPGHGLAVVIRTRLRQQAQTYEKGPTFPLNTVRSMKKPSFLLPLDPRRRYPPFSSLSGHFCPSLTLFDSF